MAWNNRSSSWREKQGQEEDWGGYWYDDQEWTYEEDEVTSKEDDHKTQHKGQSKDNKRKATPKQPGRKQGFAKDGYKDDWCNRKRLLEFQAQKKLQAALAEQKQELMESEHSKLAEQKQELMESEHSKLAEQKQELMEREQSKLADQKQELLECEQAMLNSQAGIYLEALGQHSACWRLEMEACSAGCRGEMEACSTSYHRNSMAWQCLALETQRQADGYEQQVEILRQESIEQKRALGSLEEGALLARLSIEAAGEARLEEQGSEFRAALDWKDREHKTAMAAVKDRKNQYKGLLKQKWEQAKHLSTQLADIEAVLHHRSRSSTEAGPWSKN